MARKRRIGYIYRNGKFEKYTPSENKTSEKKHNGMIMRLDGRIEQYEDVGQNNSSGYFQKSEGNTGQTIVGTAGDIGTNATAGGLGLGEKILDGLMALTPYFHNWQMNGADAPLRSIEVQNAIDNSTQVMKQGAEEFIARDLYDEDAIAKRLVSDPLKKRAGIDTETMSVLGDKSDAVVKSGAEMLGTVALNALGVPWFVTTGASSLGSETENALNSGADFEEAVASGLITAGSEILTEKLSGFFGAEGLDDAIAKKLTRGISNKFLRGMAKAGIDTAGEGTEEVVSQFISNFGTALYREENLKDILFSEEALEGYIDSYIGGAAIGNFGSATGATISEIKGIDSVTGLTKNEQKVVDAEVKNRIEEAQSSGKKLSAKDKANIREQVYNELEKGYLSIDSIERTLGGETYRQYKALADEEVSLKETIESLKKDPRASKQQELAEAEKRLSEIENGATKSQLKDQLSKEVYELAKSGKLNESYNEKNRRSQKFEADIAVYDEKQQATIQRAIDSGILNNTNRTHEFVDLIAKISADKGVLFDFTNNENLKNSGFALEGRTVNGLVKDGEIILNVNSAKALNTVVGHEITHVLEGTALYNELQQLIIKYAKAKGEYDGRLASIKELYKDIKDADVNAELVADLIGDYLFTDEKFLKSLYAENPNLFKKIYEEIKYLVKKATAGSKQARQLLEVQKAFEKAYKESTDIKGTTKYDVSEDSELYQYIQNALNGNLPKKSYHKLSDAIPEKLASDIEKIVGFSVKGYGNEISPGSIKHINKDHGPNGKTDKSMSNLHDLAKINYIIENYDAIREGKGSKEYKNSDGSNSKTVELQKKLGDDFYYVVEAVPDTKLRTLHVVSAYINKNDTFSEVAVSKDPSRYVRDELQPNVSSKYSISQKEENTTKKILPVNDAKTSYAEKLNDSEGRKLSREQVEFFKDSQVRDENGALKPVYHGTNKEFSKFESTDGIYYFSEDVDYAEAMEEERRGDRIIEVYLNLKNPYKTKLPSNKFSDPISEKSIIRYARENGYDGLIIENDTDIELEQEIFYVAFENSQIKSVDNLTPTSNPNINLSLSMQGEILPVRNYSVYGKDISLPEAAVLPPPVNTEVAPVQQDVENDDISQYVEPYSEHQKNNWKNSKKIVLYESKEQFRQFIEDAKERKNAGQKLYFGKVKPEIVERVRNELSYDIEGYNCALYSDNIKKIFKDHGDEQIEQNRGQRAVQTEDFFVIPEVVSTPDSIESGSEYKGQPVIIFKKSGMTVVGVVSEGSLDLYPQTMYISKKNRSLATAIDTNVPIKTSETTRSTASIDSIPQPSENVTSNLQNDEILPMKGWDHTEESMEEYIQNGTMEYTADKEAFVKNKAEELLKELKDLGKGKKASQDLGYLLDMGYPWSELKQALANVRGRPSSVVDKDSGIESIVREVIGRAYDSRMEAILPMEMDRKIKSEETWIEYMNQASGEYLQNEVSEYEREIEDSSEAKVEPPLMWDDTHQVETVKDRNRAKLQNYMVELQNNQQYMKDAHELYNKEIAELQLRYENKKNKNTQTAHDLLRQIERKKRQRDNIQADYEKRINRLKERIDKMNSEQFKIAEQSMMKQEEYRTLIQELIGDTSTWVDKKMGLSYKINTLRRNLRDIVRDENGNRDIARADAICDEIQGKYNHHEALLNNEENAIKQEFAKLKINAAEDAYIQMLGEYRDNPDTTLEYDDIAHFYEEHKNKIDKQKVDRVIAMARKLYDELFTRVNEVLKEQGMKEIEYRQGYFPHFTEEKQSWLAKALNWKVKSNDIPTDIAGLTENFKPNRSWQSFNKRRTGDETEYSFKKGLDTYVHGALDWIYHIEDIQKRRAFENEIRYRHSEQGIQDKIKEISQNEEYDSDQRQAQIDLIYKEANNPLNNFISDFRTATNTLAGKKSSMDRGMEEMTNRKVYSTMTNISNRTTANMVVGSISSALTQFIPITQSWAEVSPVHSLEAMRDVVRSAVRDDGTIAKSDFLTNRLHKSKNLYQTGWDKVIDKAGILMEVFDNFTSQTVWRSKYLQNIAQGMSENAAIKNADRFAENVMAGRSRGNAPTIFDSKNPLIKMATAFQLEVNNQYGYMFKDLPHDIKNKSAVNLVKAYGKMYIGAYAFNALYSALTGRDSAFDPISIVKDLLRDFGLFGDDEEKEPVDALLNFTDSVLENIPFVGGWLGGGRIPISSALPYDGLYEAFTGTAQDIAEGDWKSLTKEWLNPITYVALPAGGGQLRKTVQGLSMFRKDLPVSGSYTNGGELRFPVENNVGNVLKAAVFGQYASKNAREYFDEGYAPLNEKQIQEFKDVDLPISEYWQYREGLKEQKTVEDKFEYIADLDLPIDKKNILINNAVSRKEEIDLSNYDFFENYEEFDFWCNNKEKYQFLQDNNISYAQYKESEETKEAYDWAFKNPGKYAVAKAVSGVVDYRRYAKKIDSITADTDANGKAISGSRKQKVFSYIAGLDLELGEKLLLYKSAYPSDDTFNYTIVEYLNTREDISYTNMKAILEELGFSVSSNGTVTW